MKSLSGSLEEINRDLVGFLKTSGERFHASILAFQQRKRAGRTDVYPTLANSSTWHVEELADCSLLATTTAVREVETVHLPYFPTRPIVGTHVKVGSQRTEIFSVRCIPFGRELQT